MSNYCVELKDSAATDLNKINGENQILRQHSKTGNITSLETHMESAYICSIINNNYTITLLDIMF